jgi:hypothetical protein
MNKADPERTPSTNTPIPLKVNGCPSEKREEEEIL